ncbi:MAG: hypothetical protein IKG27_04865 [Bacilli bacterium]|nr:hypothetical protein [Bacilli bacterium]
MKKKKFNKLFWILLFLIIFIVSVLIIFRPKNPLIGTWTTDGVTIYRFDKKGKGALIVPLSKYTFNYKMNDDEIHIDFKNKKLHDSDYKVSFKKGKLILKGINKTTGTYTFKKHEAKNAKK